MPSPNSYALIEIKHAEPAGMSRLGHNGHPEAKHRCPLYPRKQTSAGYSRNVRFVPEEDISKHSIEACPPDGCFTPESGQQLSALGCPLSAKSGHQLCGSTTYIHVKISPDLPQGDPP